MNSYARSWRIRALAGPSRTVCLALARVRVCGYQALVAFSFITGCQRRRSAMPVFERPGISLYYEEFGSGYPLLLFAPGGMRSSIEFWHRSPFDPTIEFAGDFRVIAMDQRNAGRSPGPVRGADGWHTYAADH